MSISQPVSESRVSDDSSRRPLEERRQSSALHCTHAALVRMTAARPSVLVACECWQCREVHASAERTATAAAADREERRRGPIRSLLSVCVACRCCLVVCRSLRPVFLSPCWWAGREPCRRTWSDQLMGEGAGQSISGVRREERRRAEQQREKKNEANLGQNKEATKKDKEWRYKELKSRSWKNKK